jgi:3-phosphoshikimate 1-carboxyvinyltransferase
MQPVNSTLIVTPGSPLHGEYCLPGDKSISHRAALLAVLAEGESTIDHFLVAGVTRAMLDCLGELGVEWGLQSDRLWVKGKGLRGLTAPVRPLDCGNSATTLRLLAGVLAAASVPATLDGSPGLRKRPMDRIIGPLRQMGVNLSAQNGCAPIEMKDSLLPLRPLDYFLPVASAQVKSCLLLAAMAANGTTSLNEPGPSRDHTERMLRNMGVNVVCEQITKNGRLQYVTRITPSHPLQLKPLRFTVPGDFSSAAFLIIAALITPKSEILLHNVGLNPTRIGLLDVLWNMGADITISNPNNQNDEPIGDLTVRASRLNGTSVSESLVVRMIDEFPAFAVAASFAQGTTLVSQAEELHLKESDRISQLCGELATLKVNISERPDGFMVQGGSLPYGGQVQAHSDHRLAMSLALVGLAGRAPVMVQEAEAIAESFPDFVAALRSLGACVEMVQ